MRHRSKTGSGVRFPAAFSVIDLADSFETVTGEWDPETRLQLATSNPILMAND
jgi:hypothetical protein